MERRIAAKKEGRKEIERELWRKIIIIIIIMVTCGATGGRAQREASAQCASKLRLHHCAALHRNLSSYLGGLCAQTEASGARRHARPADCGITTY